MAIQNIQPFNYSPSAKYLFRRAYALSIGAPKQTAALRYSNFIAPGQSQPSPLRVRFDIEKTPGGSSNKCKIEIFNMSEQSRQAIKKGYLVELSAGYNNLVKRLFIGNIHPMGLKSERNGPDIITTMECGDGESSISMSNLHKTYPAGSTLKQLITDVGREMGAISSSDPAGLEGAVFQGVQNFTYSRGFVIDGPCSQTLDTFLKPRGLAWSVSNGVLHVLPIGSPLTTQAILVSADTGMIGVPSQNDQYTEFTSLINPTIGPGALTKLASQNTGVNGFYTVLNAHYEGDTHDTKWQVKCQCTQAQNIVTQLPESNGFSFGNLA